jgi:hypothetical protein
MSQGVRQTRRKQRRTETALQSELRPDELPTCVTATRDGLVAVTPERVVVIGDGAVLAAFDRVLITSITVDDEVTVSGVDGVLLRTQVADPWRLAEAAAPVPLLTRYRRDQLERIGREAFLGDDFRLVEPSGPDLVLEAARIMGLASTTPRDPRWRVFEARVCAELLRTEGWELAGALLIVDAIGTAHRHPFGLEVIDRATAFLAERGVSPRSLPDAARDRWVSLRGWSA